MSSQTTSRFRLLQGQDATNARPRKGAVLMKTSCFLQGNSSNVDDDVEIPPENDWHINGVQSRLTNKPDMVVNDLVTSELARYKELVGEYEKRAKFELTDRERKIDEQMRIIISDRNRKETSLKS
ncbi:hypothetical protein Tco_0184085 [Tanacetum coccineum]